MEVIIKMYFTNIFNIEAQKLIRVEQVELVLKISELDNRYWNIENMDDGNILRIIPLFNCNNITSSNPDDIVREKNQCLICKNDINTVITCY